MKNTTQQSRHGIYSPCRLCRSKLSMLSQLCEPDLRKSESIPTRASRKKGTPKHNAFGVATAMSKLLGAKGSSGSGMLDLTNIPKAPVEMLAQFLEGAILNQISRTMKFLTIIYTLTVSSFLLSCQNEKKIEPIPDKAESQQNLSRFKDAVKLFRANKYEQSLTLFLSEFETGQYKSCFYIGYCHLHGCGGVKLDKQEALKWFKIGADNNDARSLATMSFLYERGELVDQNLDLAYKLLRQAADDDNSLSCLKLGKYYLGESFYLNKRNGFKRDFAKAVKYFKKGANQEDSDCIYELASCYKNGYGVEENIEKANALYEQAGNLGNNDALRHLGYYYGDSDQNADLKKSFEYFLKAAKADDLESQYMVALAYSEGAGVVKNSEKLEEWLLRSAKEGYLDSQTSLGRNYLNGAVLNKNLEEGYKWSLKAAESGHYEAQHNVGVCYDRGMGVLKDPRQAASWFLKSALQHHRPAQLNLGLAYLNGNGLLADITLAKEWLNKAISESDRHPSAATAQACGALGSIYFEGLGGSEKDLKTAHSFFLKAANQGDKGSLFTVGFMYCSGLGVEKDLREGKKWVKKAYKAKVEGAEELWNELELWNY